MVPSSLETRFFLRTDGVAVRRAQRGGPRRVDLPIDAVGCPSEYHGEDLPRLLRAQPLTVGVACHQGGVAQARVAVAAASAAAAPHCLAVAEALLVEVG